MSRHSQQADFTEMLTVNGWAGTSSMGLDLNSVEGQRLWEPPSHQLLPIFSFLTLHEGSIHTPPTSMQTHLSFQADSSPAECPHNSGQSIWELFQDPGMLQLSHSTHRSLIVQHSVLIIHTVYVREGLIGFMPLW